MRLINADAINYDDYWWNKGYSARDCQQAAKLISDQPTVDAVPVEWIEEYMNNHMLKFSDRWMAMNWMLNDWREANGTTD